MYQIYIINYTIIGSGHGYGLFTETHHLLLFHKPIMANISYYFTAHLWAGQYEDKMKKGKIHTRPQHTADLEYNLRAHILNCIHAQNSACSHTYTPTGTHIDTNMQT